MKRCAAMAAFGLAVLLSTEPAAQAKFPEQPIKLVVPYPAGGGPDIVARILAQRVGETIGQQVVIDNRAGAGGNIGADAVAHARADGHTLLMAAFGFATNVSLTPDLGWHPIRDFAPVMLVGTVPSVLVVRKDMPVSSLAELVALAKRSPGTLTSASSGTGSSPHLAMESFKRAAQVDVVHVPYKGAAQAMQDLLGGHVDFTFDNLPASLGHMKSGGIRALALLAEARSKAAPEVPTTAEAGLPGLVVAPWYGILAPAKTPPEVIDKLNAEFNAAFQNETVAKRLDELGVNVGGGGPDRFAAHLKSEVGRWATLIRDAGIKLE